MSHEPECAQRSIAAVLWQGLCICEFLRAAYRRGYNDHARSQVLGAELYGGSGGKPTTGAGPIREVIYHVQHGQGENP